MPDLKECAGICGEALAEAQAWHYCTASSFENYNGRKWRQLAMESMWRLMASGLIEYGRRALIVERPGAFLSLADLLDPQADYATDTTNWMALTFVLTPAGEDLVEEFHLVDRELPPGFEERLWEIFTQHGVGPDVPCPYQVPLDWKPTVFE